MTTHTTLPAGDRVTAGNRALSLGALLPGAAGLLFAGIQLDGGITATAYRGISDVPDDRLNFPFSGGFATATSLTWGLSQALFVLTLLAFARSGAFANSRSGRVGARLALIGGLVIVAAHGVSVAFRDTRMDDPAGRTAIALFVTATLLLAAGFVVAGTAVLRAGRWTGWRRYSVVAVGIWMLCMVPLQSTFLLGPAVAVYAATIAVFSVALLAETAGNHR